MTSPVSAIEANDYVSHIEEALHNAKGLIRALTGADDDIANAVIAEIDKAMLESLPALARQAEALQRENAEKDARIAALEAGMRPFSKFAGVVFERNFNSSDPVDTMTATDGAVSTLYARDFFGARALLGGENAE